MSLSELKKDIKIGLDCLNSVSLYDFPQGYGRIYVNTNENLSEYYQFFPIKDGKVLTVSSGGDQILQAAYCGAREVDAFDKNKFAIYAAKLKLAAVKALKQEDFLAFYNYANFKKNFSLEIYEEIRPFLDEMTRNFWDEMYYVGNFDKWNGTMTFLSSVTDKTEFRYDNATNFLQTKEALSHMIINFYHCDIYELLDLIRDDVNYDSIFLSNIYDYLLKCGRREFPELIMEKLASRLTENGKIAAYVPHHSEDCIFSEYHGEEMLDRKIYVYKGSK